MRFTRREFVSAVEDLQHMQDIYMVLNDSEKVLYGELFEDYYDLIIQMSDVEEENIGLFDYFCFTLDFGRDKKTEDIIVSVGDEEFELKTAEDLWLLLVMMENLE